MHIILDHDLLGHLPIFSTLTTRDTINHIVGISIEEERYRVPFFLREVHHLTQIGSVFLVGPPHHRIAQIDDIGFLDGLDIEPLAAGGIENL